ASVMVRRTPPAAIAVGILTILAGLGYLTFVVLWRREEMWAFLSVALGKTDAISKVSSWNHTTPGIVYTVLVSTVLEVSLLLVLLLSSMALLSLSPWARWACFWSGIFLSLLALVCLVLILVQLSKSGESLRLVPLLVYGGVLIY